VLLLGVFEDAFGAEHLFVGDAVELDLLGSMCCAVLDAAADLLRRNLRLRLLVSLHRQARQYLVVYRQIVGLDLMR